MTKLQLRVTGKAIMSAASLAACLYMLPTNIRAEEFHPNAAMQRGVAALHGGNVQQALSIFTEEAKHDNAYAELTLGQIYLGEFGAPRNYQRAAFWFAKAYRRGGEVGQAALARLIQIGRASGQSPQEVKAIIALGELARRFPGNGHHAAGGDPLGDELGRKAFNEMTDHEYENPITNPGE